MKKGFITVLILAAFSCSKKTEVPKESLNDTIRQKDGTVLTYAKPSSALISLKRDNATYDQLFQQRIRKIAEYYIANSQNSLIKYHRNKRDSSLGFSFETNDWEEVFYIQIGIFTKSGSNLSTLQWLFYQPENQQLFEFDLHKKQLIPFKLK